MLSPLTVSGGTSYTGIKDMAYTTVADWAHSPTDELPSELPAPIEVQSCETYFELTDCGLGPTSWTHVSSGKELGGAITSPRPSTDSIHVHTVTLRDRRIWFWSMFLIVQYMTLTLTAIGRGEGIIAVTSLLVIAGISGLVGIAWAVVTATSPSIERLRVLCAPITVLTTVVSIHLVTSAFIAAGLGYAHESVTWIVLGTAFGLNSLTLGTLCYKCKSLDITLRQLFDLPVTVRIPRKML
jgi:hypothetical protein